MENRAEVIQHEMEEKRASLTDKMETLEKKLTDNLTAVQDSVTGSVESVTEGVQETIASVKDALDVSKHIQEHPWMAVGGAVLLGYFAHGFMSNGSPSFDNLASDGGTRTKAPEAPGIMSGTFREGFQNLQRFAARSALDLVGKALRQPANGEIGIHLANMVDQLAAKVEDKLGDASKASN